MVRQASFIASVMAAAVGVSAVADGQVTSPGGGSSGADAGGLEEIIVTAQRSSQRLQDVPITVTAITASELGESGILNTNSLPVLTPGLVITQNRYAIQPYIRGVGTEDTVVGEEGSVATYVDGVYIPSLGAASFSFNNIDRVEVLKGPQGTLFGRNATGGLIQIITRDPGTTPQFEAGADYGTYNTVTSNLYAATPLAENLAVDLAIYEIHQFDGYGRVVATTPFFPNPNIGKDVNFARDTSGRSKLVWTPDSATKVTVALDYDYNTTDLGEARTIFPGSKLEGGFVGLGNIYDTASGTYPSTLNRQYGASLHVEHDLDFAKLSSISAYRLNRVDSVLDQDTAPITLVSAYDTEQTKSWQQEFNLHGDVSQLDWAGGVFFFHDAAEQLPLETFSSVVESVNHEQFTKQNATAYAVYAQATYKFAENTDVTGGIRYNEEYRKIGGINDLLSPPYPAPTATEFNPQKANFGSPTGRFAVDQHFAESVMGYVSYDRGFKSGEFNNTNPNQGAVKPETIDAYEVGAKTEFLDHRLKFNAAAFYYDYTNIQLQALTFNNVVLTNAAKGKLKGLDIDAGYVPTLGFGRLELTTGLEALTAHYTSFPGGVGFDPAPNGGNITVTDVDFSGHAMIRAPNWTLSSTANYGFPMGPGSADLNVAFNHNSGFYWDPDNRLHQNAYDVMNAQFSYTTPDSHWKFKIAGANLLNKVYLDQVSSSASGDIVSAAPPRTASLGFSYKY